MYESVAGKLILKASAFAEFLRNANLESYWETAVAQARANGIETILWAGIFAVLGITALVLSKKYDFYARENRHGTFMLGVGLSVISLVILSYGIEQLINIDYHAIDVMENMLMDMFEIDDYVN